MRPILQLARAAVLLQMTWLADAQSDQQSARPNIVFLLADDMGFADITAFGGRFGHTPNLDRLAASGIRMTNFHTPCAVCSPTRAALLTGRYPLANRIDSHFSDSPQMVLQDQTRPDGGPGTLPGILREHGYATLHVGKWHLGGVTLQELEHRRTGQGEYRNHRGPHQHGFDDYHISQEDASTRIRAGMVAARTLYRDGTKHLVHNDVYQFNPRETRDWTGFKGDVATRFIQERAKLRQPFFLNVWFDAPHAPYEDDHVPPEFHFAALSRQFDDKLGRPRHLLNTHLPKSGNGGQEDHKKFLSMISYTTSQDNRWDQSLASLDGGEADSPVNDVL
ncbi:MAG: sulfatase-like hydrolase/transferase [Planctomycetes bacterium]|nr:sulfatase-like hydrolase/transferase [Planctomycetota bacterium]